MQRLLLALALLLACSAGAQGQNTGGHFRFGTIFWKRVESEPNSNTVEITIETAWRRSYSSNYFTAAQMPDHTLMQINGKESPVLDLGDGKMMYLEKVRITAWSQAEDWFLGEQVFRHTYDRPNNAGQPWMVSFKGCCRMSELRNNGNQAWEMKMGIDMLKASASPRVVALPVVYFSKPAPGLPTKMMFNLRTAMGYDGVIWTAPVPGTNAPANYDGLPSTVTIMSPGNVTVDVAMEGLLHVTAYAHIAAHPEIMVPVDVIVNVSAAANTDPQFDEATRMLFPREHVARPGFPFSADIGGFMGQNTDPSNYVGFTVGPLPEGAHLSTVRGKGTSPSDVARMTLHWTPCVSQIGKSVVCFDVVNNLGMASTQRCLAINVVADAAPAVSVSLGGVALGPMGPASPLLIGVSYVFQVTATDSNAGDSLMIKATKRDGSMCGAGDQCTPPTSMMGMPWSWMGPSMNMSTAVNLTFAPKHNHGGYVMEHCFTASDACGAACGDFSCPGVVHNTVACVRIRVDRCQFVVRQGQELQEIAAIYNSDWLQLWSLNHQLSNPDVNLMPGNVVNVGHLYAVQPFDKPRDVAQRFGMSDESFATLNADVRVGDMSTEQCQSITECSAMRWCILPSSCDGASGSIYQGAYASQPWFAAEKDVLSTPPLPTK
uniref:LysM domain-containing protein n=2 Tax=Hemiselmis andersenii TaxID=464988 RepID=A0A6U2IRD1_HEMAN